MIQIDLEVSWEANFCVKVLVPPLRVLEAEIFQQLFQHMWSCVLMEGITADQLPGNSRKSWSIQPNQQEEAVERWIDAFQVKPISVPKSHRTALELVVPGT